MDSAFKPRQWKMYKIFLNTSVHYFGIFFPNHTIKKYSSGGHNINNLSHEYTQSLNPECPLVLFRKCLKFSFFHFLSLTTTCFFKATYSDKIPAKTRLGFGLSKHCSRAAYSICESWVLIHQDVYRDLYVCS